MHLSFVLLCQLPNCIQLDNDDDIQRNSVSYVPLYNDIIIVTQIQVLYLNFSYVNWIELITQFLFLTYQYFFENIAEKKEKNSS